MQAKELTSQLFGFNMAQDVQLRLLNVARHSTLFTL